MSYSPELLEAHRKVMERRKEIESQSEEIRHIPTPAPVVHAQDEPTVNYWDVILTFKERCFDCGALGIERSVPRRDMPEGRRDVPQDGTIPKLCPSCTDKRQFSKMCKETGIPERYRVMESSTYEARTPEIESIKRKVQSLSSAGKWIVLMGKRGLGKTHLGIVCLKHAYRNGRGGHYISAVTFLPYFVRSGYKRDEVWDEQIAPYRCLMLDDLGQGETAKAEGDIDERVRSEVGAIVDYYYRNNRQLIITTNIESVKELIDRYGAWVVDRIIECGEFVIFPNDLNSMRSTIKERGKQTEGSQA